MTTPPVVNLAFSKNLTDAILPTASNSNASLTDEIDGNIDVATTKGYVTDNPDLWFYQSVYLYVVVGMMVIGFIKGFYIAVFFIRGSTRMHDQMLQRFVIF